MSPGRLALVLTAALVALAGCSDGGETIEAGDDASSTSTVPPTEVDQAADLTVSLEVDPDPPVSGSPVTWTVTVENTSDAPITVTAASGLVADVSLHDGDTETYRWSDGRVFTQALQEISFEPGEPRAFPLPGDTLEVDPGEYMVRAEFISRPAPAPFTRTLAVEER